MPALVTDLLPSKKSRGHERKKNELIPKAIKAISTTHIADDHGNVQKEYKGYIASIGASIVQAGLLPTLAFYQNDSGKKAHSSNVLQAIRILIAPSQTLI
jgi:CRISPR-associated protein Cmr5